ncbi:MAG: hypothetical protein JOZ55_00270 [Alphaproteobacteria bacterium]|nr:hypothetical protein [Alphaproteobacteria bacterium]
MRIHLLAAGTLALALPLALSARAGDEVMANYFGNTVVAQSQMGIAKIHYRPNHTFGGTASGPGGEIQLSGSWKIDEKGQLCRSYEHAPPGSPSDFCTPWEAHKVGDSWTMTANGQTAQISLVAGK